MILTEAISAILSGGVTGLIGSAITAYSEIKKQKLQFQHDEKMEELSLQMTKLETEAQFKIVEVETAGKVDVADADALAKSYEADKATYTIGTPGKIVGFFLGMVDVLRGSVRPIITYYFVGLISVIFFRFFWKYAEAGVTVAAVEEILGRIVTVVLYVGTTCILWWFGTRNKAFNGKK